MIKKLFVVIALLLSLGISAQDIPGRPNPPRLVNDLAQVLTEGQALQMENQLVSFARQTSTQIVVVTVPTLNGYAASDYAFRLGEEWGVGQKDKDNGVIVLFKPKTAEENGQVFVAVGYGLEGVIPDAVANRDIVNHEMIPRFKAGDVYGGLSNGVQVIMALASGEFSAQEYQDKVAAGGSGFPFFILIFLIFFVIIPILRGKRRYYNTGRSSLPLWLIMGGLMGSGHRSGGWSNFSGGSGSFGGGGFGGFGGGGFGGGGAGGSW
ncbi:TPM domain-containing protein [Gaoshiqia sp. Z1-71]|uniref:TPM domain-containing protein n=1 Tax=Gaoshiqia hydrogeniformans TaxID=3290090 RepID=UPI003BF87909